MTRTTTGLAVAAVAAALTAGTLAMDAGTTAALWRDSDTVSEQSITAGSLAISNITRTPGPEVLEFDPAVGQPLTTTVETLLDGTGLGGVLQMSYTWAASYAPEVVDALNVTAKVSGQDIAPTGSLTTGLEFEVLLLPEGTIPPTTWQGPVVFFDGSTPTVTFDLTVTSETLSSEPLSSWALGASGVSESGPTGGQVGDVAATLTQFSSGTTGPWSHDSTASGLLPVLYFFTPIDVVDSEEPDETSEDATEQGAEDLDTGGPDTEGKDDVTDGDQEPEGGTADGEVADSGTTDGEVIDGDTTDGDVADSGTTDGDVADSGTTDGDVADSGTTDGDQEPAGDPGTAGDTQEPTGDPGTAGDTQEPAAEGPQDDVLNTYGSQTDPPSTDVEPEASALENAALPPGKDGAAYMAPDDDDGGDQE